MTKPLLFSISVFVFVAANARAQYLKVDNGVSFTSFNTNNMVRIPAGRHTAYTGAIGMDYLEKNWYYLSSEIGYLSMGASETTNINPGLDFRDEKKLMLHLNTTFRVFLDLDDYKLFAGAGPYLNIGFRKQSFRLTQWYPYVYAKNNGGAQIELGITRELHRMRVGVLGTYMHGLSPAATGENVSIRNNGLTARLTVGYRLGKSTYNKYRSNSGRVR